MGKTAKDVMDTALSYLGVKENPPYSNNVIFNTHYYGHEVYGSQWAWCAVYGWDIFRIAGASELFYDGGKTAGCCQILEWGRKRGLEVSKYDGKYGDIILFDWDNTGYDDADHVGFIICKNFDGSYTTIEGNTSAGNDSDGGEVMKRIRYTSTIRAILRPKYESSTPGPISDVIPYDRFPVIQRGSTDEVWVKIAQAGVGLMFTDADGGFGDKTNHWVIDFQKKHGLTPDGIVGPKTWKAIFYDADTWSEIPAVYRGKVGRSVVICQACLEMPAKYLDGRCGDITVGNIISFQKDHSIKADGGCGQLTWRELIMTKL